MKRTLAGISALALAAVACASAPASGSTPKPNRPLSLNDRGSVAVSDLANKPLGLRPDRTVRLVVRMSGESVSETSVAAGRKLTLTEQKAGRSRVLASHAPVEDAITKLGGKVERHYTDAVNGLAVSVPVSAVGSVAAIAGVVDVQPTRLIQLDNTVSNTYTGVTGSWEATGRTGLGVKIAIIDDGIDYSHAMFGGSGQVADYTGNDRTVIEPGSFPTAKVIAGYDFVGDDYDAAAPAGSPALVPVPDSDPMACGEHGTHVAGTAAGAGVTSTGATYAGPYTAAGVSGLKIGPGSAPQAKLMAYKVFGCDGSVDDSVLIAAIDRAVADGANVINMSLGSSYGRPDGVEAAAITNASAAGVVVVASAGNSGHGSYLAGGPSTTPAALSVAAMDAAEGFPGGTYGGITLINANGIPLSGSAAVVVVRTPDGGVSLGCNVADFPSSVVGKVAVVQRGTCARVDKAINAEKAGAIGTIMINTVAGFPPYEGVVPGLNTPFYGASATDRATVLGWDGTSISIAPTSIANPMFAKAADFTSGGPRSGDSGIKPDVSAPGVSLVSSLRGSGNGFIALSGTSMAAPHTTGIVALLKQAHPDWSSRELKAAVVDSAIVGSKLEDNQRLSGNGLVSAGAALATKIVALPAKGWDTGLSFGATQGASVDQTRPVRLINKSGAPLKVNLSTSVTDPRGAVFTVSPTSLTVPAGVSTVNVRLRISAADVAALAPADQTGVVRPVSGRLVVSPVGSAPVTMPLQVVPYGRSSVQSSLQGGAISVKNLGAHAGSAELYEWVAKDSADSKVGADLRAVGVYGLPGEVLDPSLAGDRLLMFAVNQYDKFWNVSDVETDVYLDTSGDGNPDYALVTLDGGYILTGSASGTPKSFVFDLNRGRITDYWPAFAGPDASSVVFPVLASEIGLSPANPVAKVVAVDSYSLSGSGLPDSMTKGTTFDAFNPQRSGGDYADLPGGASASFPVAARALRTGESSSYGWFVLSVDDASGTAQADLVAG